LNRNRAGLCIDVDDYDKRHQRAVDHFFVHSEKNNGKS
jgi:hypothetical protein